MKHNIGMTDRIVRMFLVFVILFLVAMGLVRAWAAVVLMVIGADLAITSWAAYSPLYALLSIDTTGSPSS